MFKNLCYIHWVVVLFLFLQLNHAQGGQRPQFVHLAFDGSKSLNMWKETRRFSKEASARLNAPVEFTYFISGVYFLTNGNRSVYHPPQRKAGRSDIGFSGNDWQDIVERMEQVNLVLEENHEIASHANGHFDGTSFSTQDWLQEFSEFENLIFGWIGNNQIDPRSIPFQSHLDLRDIKGFRAPLLGISKSIWPALAQMNFRYDTSKVSTASYWPEKSKFGVWNFPLASLRIAGSQKKTLSMDYNFYFAQTQAQSISDPDLLAKYEEQTYQTYMNYFEKNYNGNRAPIHIGHHFSKWNKGIYWSAMKRFALSVCGKPEVQCVTYSDLLNYLESQNERDIAALNYGYARERDISNHERLGSMIHSASYSAREQNAQKLIKKERLLTLEEIREMGLVAPEGL